MKKTVKKISQDLLFIISIFSLVILILALAFILLGYRPFIIKSASMEPFYPKGSLVFIDTKIPLSEIKIGDVIAFKISTGAFVLHRLIFIKDGYSLLQGDANNDAQTLHLNDTNFIGRDVFLIPRLGFVVEKMLNSYSTIWIVIISLLVLSCISLKRV